MQENYPFLVSVKPLKQDFEKFNKISITSEEFTIGRSLENNVVITHLPISRKHCVFKMSNANEWFIEDLSAFGIEVNNKKLKKGVTCKLDHDDVIQLDATADFIYKFMHNDDDFVPRKRIKLESPSTDILNNMKMKFEESQNFEIKHIEDKLNNTKQMLTTSTILKQQLELDMTRKMEQLETDFAAQIENLKGEKNEVERQKALLEEERDSLLATVKQEMESKITDLMDEIKKHNEKESELLNENASLKEKLLKEREEFMEELHKENTSKKELLQQLEDKFKEQVEIRLREKQELENELKKLEEQKKAREQQLEKELTKIKFHLADQMLLVEAEKQRLELELETKTEEMAKANEEEKTKLLLQERAEAEKKLAEAQTRSEQCIKELEKHVKEREVELAALAAERIQQQAEQSAEVITTLQQQLEHMRSELLSLETVRNTLETEKNSLIESLGLSGPAEGSSKEATLTEVGNLMESELQCSICAELLVAATTLNCAHTFCKYCITLWKKKKKDCPICRAAIISECKSLVLDSFIEKMVANLTDEMKQKRQAMLRDREELEAELIRQTATGSRRRSSSYGGSQRGAGTDSEYDSEYAGEEEDYYDDNHSYYDDDQSDIEPFHRYGSSSEYSDGGLDTDASGSDGGDALDARPPPAAATAAAAASDLPAAGAAAGGSHASSTLSLAAGSSGAFAELGSGASAGATGAGRRRRRRREHVEGTPGSFYGGYGRCFRCGARGHWAPGCPLRR